MQREVPSSLLVPALIALVLKPGTEFKSFSLKRMWARIANTQLSVGKHATHQVQLPQRKRHVPRNFEKFEEWTRGIQRRPNAVREHLHLSSRRLIATRIYPWRENSFAQERSGKALAKVGRRTFRSTHKRGRYRMETCGLVEEKPSTRPSSPFHRASTKIPQLSLQQQHNNPRRRINYEHLQQQLRHLPSRALSSIPSVM